MPYRVPYKVPYKVCLPVDGLGCLLIDSLALDPLRTKGQTVIKLQATRCDTNATYTVTFCTEAQAVEFYDRKKATHAFAECEDAPLTVAAAPSLLEALYPSCPHGLSLWLCADPINHYPADR